MTAPDALPTMGAAQSKMETHAATSFLAPRVRIVLGKGGVGKTTVSTALALAGARAGKNVLVVQMEPSERGATFLGLETAATYEPRRTPSGVWVLAMDGRQSLEEYLGLVVPARRLLAAVFHSNVYQYFVAAAPGLKELMAVGKVWFEAERRDDQGGKRWDLIVVDAPATGHGLQYLRMPRAARDTFAAGLVRREAARVEALLEDPAATAIDLVTTAEEMPVTETIEAYTQIIETLRLPLGMLVVNRVHDGTADHGLAERLRAGAGSLGADDRRLTEAIARAATEENGWAAINRVQLGRLRAAIPLPTVVLPAIYAETFGAADVRTLADALEREWHLGPADPRRAPGESVA